METLPLRKRSELTRFVYKSSLVSARLFVPRIRIGVRPITNPLGTRCRWSILYGAKMTNFNVQLKLYCLKCLDVQFSNSKYFFCKIEIDRGWWICMNHSSVYLSQNNFDLQIEINGGATQAGLKMDRSERYNKGFLRWKIWNERS